MQRESLENDVSGIEGAVDGSRSQGFLQGMRDNLSAFLYGAGCFAFSSYGIPTSVRLYPEMIDRASRKVGDSIETGWLFGVSLVLLQVTGYAYACKQGYPEVLALPLATNIFSAGYEVGRRNSNRG